MKALKFTLVVVAIAAIFTSCTKQDLNEDDVLIENTESRVYTKGNVPD